MTRKSKGLRSVHARTDMTGSIQSLLGKRSDHSTTYTMKELVPSKFSMEQDDLKNSSKDGSARPPKTNRSIVHNSGDERESQSEEDDINAHPPVISKSKIKKGKTTPQRTSSGSSIYTAIKKYAVGTTKSKDSKKLEEGAGCVSHKDDDETSRRSNRSSSSYLSKLASKASKTTKSMASRALSVSLHRGSFHGDNYEDQRPLSGISLVSGRDDDPGRPLSEYSSLASPPPTPSTIQTSTRFAPLSSHISMTLALNDQEENDSIGIHGAPRWGDEKPIMISDRSIQQFSVIESQKSNAPDQNENGSSGDELPSFTELLEHVRTMSAVLQRQIFRLQRQLNAEEGRSKRYEGRNTDRPDSHKNGGSPKAHRDLIIEIQRLFDDCDDTFQDAFFRVDHPDELHASLPSIKPRHVQGYRKSLTLERAFVDQLRRQYTASLAKYDIISTDLGTPHKSHLDPTDNGDFDDNQTSPVISSSTLNTSTTQPLSYPSLESSKSSMSSTWSIGRSIRQTSEGDLNESKTLSVVFEDGCDSPSRSNSSKSHSQ
jgi:hypothetical protein